MRFHISPQSIFPKDRKSNGNSVQRIRVLVALGKGSHSFFGICVMRVGIRKRKLPVYVPDSPENMWNAIQYPYTDSIAVTGGMEFELAVSERTQYSTGKGHMTDMEAGRSAREGNAKALCLYHLPSDGDLLFMRERAAAEFGKPVLTPDLRHIYYV